MAAGVLGDHGHDVPKPVKVEDVQNIDPVPIPDPHTEEQIVQEVPLIRVLVIRKTVQVCSNYLEFYFYGLSQLFL